jgi:hypothetical protein
LTTGVNDTSDKFTAGVTPIIINLKKKFTIVEIEDNLPLVSKTPVVTWPGVSLTVGVPLVVNIGTKLGRNGNDANRIIEGQRKRSNKKLVTLSI